MGNFRSVDEAIATVAANAELLDAVKVLGHVRGEVDIETAREAYHVLIEAWEARERER